MNALLFLACSGSSIHESGLSSSSPEVADVTQLFTIPERPFDMAFSDDTLHISADASGKLYQWDGSQLNEIVGNFSDIQAIAYREEDLYYTITDNGVTGGLVHNSETLMTQSSDGTLLRWPVDLLILPNQDILIADFNAALVFSYTTTGEQKIYSVGSQSPLALAWHENILYIGGEDGIWKKEWPDGMAVQIDTRVANGLAIHNGEIFASNTQDGIFIIDGTTYSLPSDIGRPSTILIHQDTLYLIDQVGRGIWTLPL